MKTLTLVLVIVFSAHTFSQWNEKSVEKAPLDINSKAEELGIKPEQLEGILNTASNQKGGDPEPEAIQEWFFTGAAAGDRFGTSVSSAGDVNGDGYDDLIVGAYLNDAGGNAAGRAYIYYGGEIINSNADVILTGATANDNFGYSVSTAGDVNGDGFSDVIVGAYYSDAGGSGFGSAYIYFGNSIMDNTADVIFSGTAVNDYFGYSVSTAGDVNGDGYADVIVGAYLNDIGGTDAGRAYIYFGGVSMDNTADVTLTGAAADDRFGASVSTAGDVNGDGFVDIIVGAYGNDAGGSFAGSSYIYFGGSSMDNIADITLTGAAPADYFGIAVSTAGDVNGDGFVDVIVGAHLNDAGGSGAGRAYIYFGGSSMDNTADITLTGTTVDDYLGTSVSTAGDVNGDGFADVIVGANANDVGGTTAGRAYIYFGGSSMNTTADVIFTGAAANDYFGVSVSTAGDVNSDGYADVVVGAYLNDAGGTDAGKAYLYTNSLTGTDIPDEFFTGIAADDYLGYSVACAGDVNGDGYDDIIVGAYNNDVGGTNAGRAYIYFGGPLLDNLPDITLTGAAAGDFFGYAVAGAGDVNSDGYSDVIVGAYGNDAAGTTAGRAYIYFGGPSMDITADVTMTGVLAGDALGFAVASAGDVNEDGYSDVIVGSPTNDAVATDAGRAYIYFGGISMNSVADVILAGAAASDFFGGSVSGAGDVNGDGYDDVIVGAYYNDAGGTNAGRAYIYFGGASMNNTVDVTLTGSGPDDWFGYSVSSAGDVNSDEYSDVIVGAYLNDPNGRAYIYFGGASMNNTADVTMTGDGIAESFGYYVADAGDLNGDGYSDVIVGAPHNDVGGTNAGAAYVYFGGAGMDNTADITMISTAVGEQLGHSVASAGNVNGDIFSDVIVGAPYNDAGGTDAGRAYLYLSSSPPIIPRIASIKDVLFDQGGQVKIKWVRSGYDVKGISLITDYLIQRSDPPDEFGFAWENIATMVASNELFYSYIAETPNDSMTNNSGTYYFRIIARTADPNQYWRSNILYGHSVDNLAPLPPESFYAQMQGDDVKLGWQANLEEDFRDYRIYRSDTPITSSIVVENKREIESPDAFTLIGTTTDTTFTDTSALTGTAYYYIQAYDIHDNGSAYSADSIEAILSANIRVFLEGAYVGGQMSTFINTLDYIPLSQPFNTTPWNYTGTESVTSVPANVTDWILVELRSTTTTVVDRRAAFIKNDGTLVDLDGVSSIKFPAATSGDYYVVITHRNHLPVMTANPVAISFNPALYDMRTDISKAYGTNAMKDLGGGYYGMYTADTDGSGTVNAADRSNTWNQRNLSGYYGTDVDLSGTVNAADRSSVWNNRNLSTQVPIPVDRPITEIVKENNQ